MKAWRSGQCLREILSSVLMTLNKITNCTLEISEYLYLMKILFWRFLWNYLNPNEAKILFTDTLNTFDGGFLWVVSGRVESLTHPCSRTNEPVTKMSRICHELTGVTRDTCHIVSRDQRTISRIWNGNWQMEIKLHCYCYSLSVFCLHVDIWHWFKK